MCAHEDTEGGIIIDCAILHNCYWSDWALPPAYRASRDGSNAANAGRTGPPGGSPSRAAGGNVVLSSSGRRPSWVRDYFMLNSQARSKLAGGAGGLGAAMNRASHGGAISVLFEILADALPLLVRGMRISFEDRIVIDGGAGMAGAPYLDSDAIRGATLLSEEDRE